MPQSLPIYRWGPFTRFGVWAAALTAAVDQASKLWLLFVFDLPAKAPVHLGPFIELVLAWNTGISFSLFPQVGPLGQWALLAIKLIAVLLLWIWLSRADGRLIAVALGLIIGGAVGNGIDRLLHGAVLDFILFHVITPRWRFDWYVFNLADAAIVVGVTALLYESILGRDVP